MWLGGGRGDGREVREEVGKGGGGRGGGTPPPSMGRLTRPTESRQILSFVIGFESHFRFILGYFICEPRGCGLVPLLFLVQEYNAACYESLCVQMGIPCPANNL